MRRILCIVGFAAIVAGAALPSPAWAALELFIACEGSESGGGGMTTYQYTLVNTGPNPELLTVFYLGTQDLNPANYSNWVAPPGFAPVAVVADWNTLFYQVYPVSVMYTTQTKTPHGFVPPPQGVASAGGILWMGSITLAPQQQATFGFDNPYRSWDMEWLAEHPSPPQVSQGFPNLPIAGPLGVFTQGWVHGPGEEQPQGCWLNCPGGDGGYMGPNLGNRSPDQNSDAVLNLNDLAMFATRFPPGGGAYHMCADFNCSGTIDIADVAIFAVHYGPPGCSGTQPGFCN